MWCWLQGRVGRALAAAALIEANDAVLFGVEKRRCLGSSRRRDRRAEDHRLAGGLPLSRSKARGRTRPGAARCDKARLAGRARSLLLHLGAGQSLVRHAAIITPGAAMLIVLGWSDAGQLTDHLLEIIRKLRKESTAGLLLWVRRPTGQPTWSRRYLFTDRSYTVSVRALVRLLIWRCARVFPS